MKQSVNNNFKLLHLSTVAGNKGGGVSEVVNSLIRLQVNAKSNISLWFVGIKSELIQVIQRTKIDISKLSVMPWYVGVSGIIFFSKSKNKFDIIHQHGVFVPLSILTIFLRRWSKIIISPHGYLEPDKLKVSKIKKKIVLFLYENYNLKHANCIVACSKKEAISLRNYGLNQPIGIIPNGINNSMLKKKFSITEISLFKKKYNINPDKKVLLFFARIHPWKGLDLFLKVVFDLQKEFRENNWMFLIAGSDELDHTNELMIYINKKHISDIVKIIEPQYDNNRIITYDIASCFVLPSKGENFGISVIEALSRSVPVITTKNTPWVELETNNCGWWIDRNENAFKKTLLNLFLKDTVNLNEMGDRGKKLVKKNYTWMIVAAQFNNLYQWVMSDFDSNFKKNFKVLTDED